MLKQFDILYISPSEIWQTYLPSTLGKRVEKLFLSRTTKPLTQFCDRVVLPQLYDLVRGTYIPVAHTPRTLDRNSDWASLIADHPEVLGCDALCTMPYFANELALDRPIDLWGDGSELALPRPSERVSVGASYVFTLESDVPCVDFLRHQIEWVTPRKNSLECPIGKFYGECSRYGDFEGICVAYSGHKSLHIHVVFDTAYATAQYDLSARTVADVRRGFEVLWDGINAIFRETVDTQGHEADISLRLPEQYRRLPNAVRKIENGHLLGIPAGTELPQLALWEKFRERASSDQMPFFFSPDAFLTPKPEAQASRPYAMRSLRLGTFTEAELEHCSRKLRAAFPDWPRFSHLAYEGEHYAAHFWNSAQDQHPSSILRDDYETIQCNGRDAATTTQRRLPAPLGTFLALWRQEVADFDDTAEVARDVLVHEQEALFRAAARDKQSAWTAMSDVIGSIKLQRDFMLLRGPEGVGKTSGIIERYHEFAQSLQDQGDSPLGMFAFADYDAARTKADAFNACQEPRGFYGVVLPSFSRVYEEICVAVNVKRFTRLDAAALGCRDILSAVRRRQPTVVQQLQTRHTQLWNEIGDRVPVFFTVHDVMHRWRTDCPTRLMWAPSYWQAPDPLDAEARSRLRKEITLGLAVHDEVKADHLCEVHSDALCEWTRALGSSRPNWRRLDFAQQIEALEDFSANSPPPRDGGRETTIDDVLQIMHFNERAYDRVTTRDTGEYGQPRSSSSHDRANPFEAVHGRTWRVQERDWWNGLAHQTILLTTERVPTLIAAARDTWTVFDLQAPSLERSKVGVVPMRSVTSKRLARVCADFLDKHVGWAVISNRAPMLDEVKPHVTARGSNEYIGKDVMQTMTFFPPHLYERLQVLNAWAGRSDMVTLAHIDEFDQSAGRNMGLRWTGGVEHLLLINRSLFKLLAVSSALGTSRYRWEPILDKHQRSRLLADDFDDDEAGGDDGDTEISA